MITNRQRLAERYPAHLDRILALALEAHGGVGWLDAPADGRALCEAFIWSGTEEGFDHWARLAEAEGFTRTRK
jgi:hypothetical protein